MLLRLCRRPTDKAMVRWLSRAAPGGDVPGDAAFEVRSGANHGHLRRSERDASGALLLNVLAELGRLEPPCAPPVRPELDGQRGPVPPAVPAERRLGADAHPPIRDAPGRIQRHPCGSLGQVLELPEAVDQVGGRVRRGKSAGAAVLARAHSAAADAAHSAARASDDIGGVRADPGDGAYSESSGQAADGRGDGRQGRTARMPGGRSGDHGMPRRLAAKGGVAFVMAERSRDREQDALSRLPDGLRRRAEASPGKFQYPHQRVSGSLPPDLRVAPSRLVLWPRGGSGRGVASGVRDRPEGRPGERRKDIRRLLRKANTTVSRPCAAVLALNQ
mmetsp:Transcript_55517/g.161240  ORF Transcript_55517/g.161240 Transcript_55517/m.161240 type:complete len:332 (+) Transcript_55517:1013-2008(+)